MAARYTAFAKFSCWSDRCDLK